MVVMIRNWGETFAWGGTSKKCLDSIFSIASAFSNNMNTIHFKIFPEHGKIYRFQRKLNKDSGERVKSYKIYRNMRKCILKVNPEGLVRLPFCWFLSGGWDILWKRGGNRIIEYWFWNRILRYLLHTCIGSWKKLNARPVCYFIVTSTNNPLIIELFWFA